MTTNSPDPDGLTYVRIMMDRTHAAMSIAEQYKDGAELHEALDALLDLLGDQWADPLGTPVVVAVARALTGGAL